MCEFKPNDRVTIKEHIRNKDFNEGKRSRKGSETIYRIDFLTLIPPILAKLKYDNGSLGSSYYKLEDLEKVKGVRDE